MKLPSGSSGGCQDVLWVNPNPTQAVAEGTLIPCDLSNYDQAFIIQKAGLGTVQRDYSASTTGVTAGWTHGDGAYYGVPYMIIGIKNS